MKLLFVLLLSLCCQQALEARPVVDLGFEVEGTIHYAGAPIFATQVLTNNSERPVTVTIGFEGVDFLHFTVNGWISYKNRFSPGGGLTAFPMEVTIPAHGCSRLPFCLSQWVDFEPGDYILEPTLQTVRHPRSRFALTVVRGSPAQMVEQMSQLIDTPESDGLRWETVTRGIGTTALGQPWLREWLLSKHTSTADGILLFMTNGIHAMD